MDREEISEAVSELADSLADAAEEQSLDYENEVKQCQMEISELKAALQAYRVENESELKAAMETMTAGLSLANADALQTLKSRLDAVMSEITTMKQLIPPQLEPEPEPGPEIQTAEPKAIPNPPENEDGQKDRQIPAQRNRRRFL
jgi:DNA uptake protein ComE-like DNA-binding protein